MRIFLKRTRKELVWYILWGSIFLVGTESWKAQAWQAGATSPVWALILIPIFAPSFIRFIRGVESKV